MTPDVPPQLDPDTRAPGTTASAEAMRRRRAVRARQALVHPWSAERARRVRIVALALVVVGPLLGTAFALVLVPSEPSDLLTADPGHRSALDVEATLRSIDPASGEMGMRLVVSKPDGDHAVAGLSEGAEDAEEPLFDSAGRLTDDVTLIVNDIAGQGVRTLEQGQPPGSLGITVALTGSRITRYPLDGYEAGLVVIARRGGPDGELLPLRVGIRGNDPAFTADVTDDASNEEAFAAEIDLRRRATSIGWAGFFVLLCWILAISAASIGWMTIVHGTASPAWSFGFLIGILFALPPLRNALPGNPPGGSLVDWAAFYWAVAIVVLTLAAMIGSWNLRVRRAPGSPDAPRP